MANKERIDKLMVQQQLAGSRERARALILAGRVLVDDQVVDKVGTQVYFEAAIRLRGEDISFVSRGGLKLAKHWNFLMLSLTGELLLTWEHQPVGLPTVYCKMARRMLLLLMSAMVS